MHEEIISEIKNTSEELLKSVKDLTPEQFSFKVNANVWSIHECMEHIVITEIAIYRILLQHNENESESTDNEKLGKEKIQKNLSDRETKSEAPDDVKPIGRFSNFTELSNKFISNRKKIIDALASGEIIFSNRIINHPILGEMTKMDWLHFMIHHCERHCKQIGDIRSYIQLQAI